jgi:GntR family transcriptional regulator, transcriptional repressor for pyruvate dehydrogenase complex
MVLKLDRVSRGPHLPALVASSISREIAQGRLRPGDRLPNEQALATIFGVSRNVVREAIVRLRFEGLVWAKQGRGAFVGDAPAPAVLKMDHAGMPPADAFRSLFELRDILEVQAAGLAARMRDARDLQQMRAALDRMLTGPYGSIAWLEGDLNFHCAIASATHNPYVEQFIAFIAERVRESILAAGYQHRSDEMARATLSEHEDILAAIQAGDSDGAMQAMRAHLSGAAVRVGLTKPLGRAGKDLAS